MASWRPDFAKFSWSSHSASKHRAWALLVNSMAFPARSHIERLGPENGGRRNDSIRPMSRNISYSPSTGPRFLKFSASEIADPTFATNPNDSLSSAASSRNSAKRRQAALPIRLQLFQQARTPTQGSRSGPQRLRTTPHHNDRDLPAPAPEGLHRALRPR